MGIILKKGSAGIAAALRRKVGKIVVSAATEAFGEVGEELVNGIVSGDLSSWNDQSGALRSSIGCGVVCSGQIIKTFGFKSVLNDQTGAVEGKAYLAKLAQQWARYACALIIVAGKEYAVYVEAIDGKVVLSSARLRAKHIMVDRIKEKIREKLEHENRR